MTRFRGVSWLRWCALIVGLVALFGCSETPDSAVGTWDEAEQVLAGAPVPEGSTSGEVERIGEIGCEQPSGCERARVTREFTIAEASTVGELCGVVDDLVAAWSSRGFSQDEGRTAGSGNCAVYGSAEGHDVNVFTAESDARGNFAPIVSVTVWVRRP